MTPGELLRTVRHRRGFTQAELAEAAGSSQPVISAYERGRRDPTVETLRRLLAAAGERLELRVADPRPELPPATSPEEHAARLVDVLSLAGALRFPRIDST